MTTPQTCEPALEAGRHQEGLDFLVEHLSTWQVRSLAAPRLGCGYGGLDWAEVQALIEAKLDGCVCGEPYDRLRATEL